MPYSNNRKASFIVYYLFWTQYIKALIYVVSKFICNHFVILNFGCSSHFCFKEG